MLRCLGVLEEGNMALTEREWNTLLRRIFEYKCTPFLGSELAFPPLPKRSKLAHKLACDCDYPLADTDNLPRVTQYIATEMDHEEARHQVLQSMKVPAPNFAAPGEPHAVLARLPFPIYVTTTYDNFLCQALRAAQPVGRDVRMDYCRWKDELQDTTPSTPFTLNPANPLVYHLFGSIDTPISLVLTEDDYLEYLIHTSPTKTRRHESTTPMEAIPAAVLRAFANETLLFLGYRLDDLEFRVLLRIIAQKWLQDGQRFSVQLIQANGSAQNHSAGELQRSEEQLERVRAYLGKYCERRFSIRAFWVSERAFLTELDQRYNAYLRQQNSSPDDGAPPLPRAA
jgi:hypothetical protein